jgi:diacylglycerol kinase (ATP)
MKTCFLVNPMSGGWRSAKKARELKTLLKDSRAHVVQTNQPGDAVRLSSMIAEQGYEMIVIVGGDGTINEVVNGLMLIGDQASARPTLGIIPMGSANDFARALKIPSNPVSAFARLANGIIRNVDIGCIANESGKSRFFDFSTGIGFVGAVAIESLRFRHFRGNWIYFLSALKTIYLYNKAPNMVITLNGKTIIEQPVLMLSINNTPTVGGFPLTPAASLTDGFFDAIYLGQTSRLRLLSLLLRAKVGKHLIFNDRHLSRLNALEIRSDHPLPIHVDGEIYSRQLDNYYQLTLGLIPAALGIVA